MRNDFESNYLAHWGIQKGAKRKNHKYFERIEKNGRYVYFYSQAQYDAYMRNQGKKAEARNVLSNKERTKNWNAALQSGTKMLSSMRTTGLTVAGKTKQEKTKNLQNNIASGQKQINSMLSNSKTKESEKKAEAATEEKKTKTSETDKDSKSSKKGSGSSGSKGSKGKGSKGSSGSKGSKGSGSSKEKTAKEKAAAKEKTTKEKTSTNKKTAENKPMDLDTLKKIYGKEDKDISTHNMTESEFENEMLSKYKEGSFGYLMAGNKAYKWTISDGKLIIKDFDTDNEISGSTYLKDVKEFKEFQTNKKKNK